ncbi:hypothetical protein [Streptomyces sp. TRM49041]|uniref:hypothetical protein n=1 Tax=Streptomyces sp. TRM49041 TaxID=2603216 RepID=UPI0011F05029|nr:hypothetical protein [Streptomyces sp. TRM49041]
MPARLDTALRLGLSSLAVLSLTACGLTGGQAAEKKEETGPFAGLSGPQILNKSIKATKTAESLRFNLTTTSATDGTTKAYMAVDTEGRCSGTLSIGTGTMEMIKTGGVAYLRFDEAFLREENKDGSPEETEQILKELKGRWMKTDASDPETEDSLELCELGSLLADLETGVNLAGKGEETTVNGKKALKLIESDGEETTTTYVATEGEPYLLKIVVKGGDEPGTITFTDYNKPVTAEAPAAKDILDLDETASEPANETESEPESA